MKIKVVPKSKPGTSVKPGASNAPGSSTKPGTSNAPGASSVPVSGKGDSVKVYIDSIEDSNLVGVVGDVGTDPTQKPEAGTPEPKPTPKVVLSRDFEDGDKSPFTARGPETVAVTDGGANNTSKALTVSDRSSNWHGITTDVSDIFETGQRYEVSFYAKHDEDSTQNINMSFELTADADSDTSYPSIQTVEVPAGDWTKFTVTIAEVPEHVGQIKLYWQASNNAELSFSLDEIEMVGVEKTKADAVDLSYGLPKTAFGNSILSSRLTADPFAMEYNGRVYVYGTNDSEQYNSLYESGAIVDNNYSKIKTINVYSSDDMVNWTDHGAIDVKAAAKWTHNSWAPAACHKTINGKEKFFLYFADNGSGIGVLEADSPVGPWKDPIGKQIISRSTPGCSGDEVQWLFDPAVLVDDDGQGYLYFGGFGNSKGSAYNKNPKCIRVVKLTDDMTGIVGEPVMIDAPYAFEDSGINKFNGKYYYSYCTNFTQEAGQDADFGGGNIAVMESDNPMTGFKPIGSVLPNPPGGGNNHHCFIEFKGNYYAFFHTVRDSKAAGVTASFFRSTCITNLKLGDNGNFTDANGKAVKSDSGNKKGVTALGTVDPYKLTEAETYGLANGVGTTGNSEASVDPVLWPVNCSLMNKDVGSYVGVANVDFGQDGAQGITMKMADATANKYVDYAAKLDKKITGKHDVYFVFNKLGVLVDKWQFIK